MQELIKALIKAKAEFLPIGKDKINPYYKSKYSSLDAVLSAVEPALGKHGLVLSHHAADGEFITTLHHESGDCLRSTLPLPSFSDPQNLGSYLSYCRRYAITGLLSVCSEEDDDGNAAKPGAASTTVSRKRLTPPPETAKAQPMPEQKDPPVETLKRSVATAFQRLGWDKDQILEWNSINFGGRPSAQWGAEDWRVADRKLAILIDQDLDPPF